MKIGIIGAENSHTAAIAKIINIDRHVKGFTVDYVWGETREFAKAAADTGQIPHIVERPSEMIGKIDALIVDHRHPKYHLKAALPFVKQGIPTFIDKPFCYRATEGRAFLEIARKCKTAVTSFSVIPHQRSFLRFTNSIKALGKIVAGTTYGPCDVRSEWGGVFFYGIHQVDMVVKAFGYDVATVQVMQNSNGAIAQLMYKDGPIVAMHLIKNGSNKFAITAMGKEKFIMQPIIYDKNAYLGGVKAFTKMFKTGNEPEEYDHILRPVQILEAMERSVKSGEIEKVSK
jgi:predicted dehydrogenase